MTIREIGRFYQTQPPTEFKNQLHLLLLERNIDNIPLSHAAPIRIEKDQCMLSQLLHGILSSMEEPLAVIEGNEDIPDIDFSFETICKPCQVPDRPKCSFESFKYLARYIAYQERQYDTSLGTTTGQMLPPSSNAVLGNCIDSVLWWSHSSF